MKLYAFKEKCNEWRMKQHGFSYKRLLGYGWKFSTNIGTNTIQPYNIFVDVKYVEQTSTTIQHTFMVEVLPTFLELIPNCDFTTSLNCTVCSNITNNAVDLLTCSFCTT